MASKASKRDQRDQGVFYTPGPLAEYVTREALRGRLSSAPSSLTVLDPACGDGVLLASALARILGASGLANAAGEARLEIARRHVFGVDRCAAAVEQARRTIAAMARSVDAQSDAVEMASRRLADNIRCGDSLLDSVFDSDQRFDVVVANPPFVNIRRLSQTYSAAMKQALVERYESAEGNFDLYVLFVERILQLLRSGGRAAIVTPNKLATLKYARACRRLLRDETAIDSILDASSAGLFGEADVYPFVWVFESGTAPSDHTFSVRQASCIEQLNHPVDSAEISQRKLSLEGFVLSADLCVEDKVATTALCQWGAVHSGASGFTARRMLDHLVEVEGSESEESEMPTEPESGWEFIVSGNIDRYQIELGRVRYMKHRFDRPRLQSSCPLTPIKQQLYSGSKIVLAGMSKRLEAALDDRGLALGVQVYAVAFTGVHTDYLLGVLNSKLLSYLFRLRFAAKLLSDNYLAINKAQLDQLPIAELTSRRSRTIAARIANCVRCLRGLDPLSIESAHLDQKIDYLVFDLYRLTVQEAEVIDRAVA